MSSDSPEKKVKVVDRRWFTPEGELRELPPEPPSPSPQPPPAAPPPAEPNPTAARQEEAASAFRRTAGLAPELSLVDLVDALAQPAAALLSGQVPGRGRDLEGARYYIDLLGVLRNRLGTPLSAEEARYLDDVLFQLRSLFVAATR